MAVIPTRFMSRTAKVSAPLIAPNADFVCRKSVGRGPFRLCRSPGSAHLLEGLRCDGRFIPDGRGAIRGTVALHVGDHVQGSDVPVAECGHIGIKRHRCAAPWRAPPPGYAQGRPPGTGAPMPGCRHRSTGLIHSADGAARGDLGLQDGRRRLVEVVVWLRRKPGHPPPSARGKPGRPSPGGWADGDWVTSWGGMCGRGGQVQIAGPCPARRGPGSWTVRRGRYRLFASALEGAAGFAGRT